MRTLRISKDVPGLEYAYIKKVCDGKNWLGMKKCKDQRVVEYYDFTDKAVRQKFIDLDFVAVSRSRIR